MAPRGHRSGTGPAGVLLPGPVTYRGSDADAQDFLNAVQARVATVAVRVRWLGGSAVWLDAGGVEVARVTADRPILLGLISRWVRTASRRTPIEIDIADRD